MHSTYLERSHKYIGQTSGVGGGMFGGGSWTHTHTHKSRRRIHERNWSGFHSPPPNGLALAQRRTRGASRFKLMWPKCCAHGHAPARTFKGNISITFFHGKFSSGASFSSAHARARIVTLLGPAQHVWNECNIIFIFSVCVCLWCVFVCSSSVREVFFSHAQIFFYACNISSMSRWLRVIQYPPINANLGLSVDAPRVCELYNQHLS